ncbi:MAG: hypothetical protein JNK85_05535 [Verrucomicrobiales bacterium]|nr:hypothetical protein [Verrucomicrobiales bacterium]
MMHIRYVTTLLVLASITGSPAAPIDNWHARNAGTAKRLTDVAYGNGSFVAVGEEGTILRSANGVDWSPVPSGTVARLDAIAFGNGVFVTVGGLGNKPMFTSPDGVHWTPRTNAIAGGYLDVTFNGSLFFTLAGKGAYGTSSNGIDWATGKIRSSQDPAAVAYGGGTWVVAGYKPSGANEGMLWTSSDLREWTPRESKAPNNLFAAGYIQGTFVVAGQNGVLSSSPDGTQWTLRNSRTEGFLWDFANGGDFLVASGQYGRMCYSTDGIEWTRVETGLATHLTGVTFGAGTFVAVGWDGAIAQSDPITAPEPSDSPRLRIRRVSNRTVVSWPRAFDGYQLQRSSALGRGPWEPAGEPVIDTATEHTVEVPEFEANAVFRLAR